MREHRILFSEGAWKLVQQEAREAGVSAGQFVREASIAYAVWRLSRRGGNDVTGEVERIIERLRSGS
jgi:hypothetical protein